MDRSTKSEYSFLLTHRFDVKNFVQGTWVQEFADFRKPDINWNFNYLPHCPVIVLGVKDLNITLYNF